MYFRTVLKPLIIPLIAAGCFLVGIVSVWLPFLPIGWLMLAVTALLLVPYFRFIRRIVFWLSKKDRTGLISKAGEQAIKLYIWAEDQHGARLLERLFRRKKKRLAVDSQTAHPLKKD